MTGKDRSKVIEAWGVLEDDIVDYYDDFQDEKLKTIEQSWREYVSACIAVNEGFFCLPDIMSDSMENVPSGYPQELASLPRFFEPIQIAGMFDTPVARKTYNLKGE